MFSWDQQKAAVNHRKHNVTFEEAATVFADADGMDFIDSKHSHLEQRFLRLGISVVGRVLLVSYTLRETSDDKETIRIISARQASRKERKAYSRL